MVPRTLRRALSLLLLLGCLSPRAADAFCGFYVGGADAKLFNNATLVVLMRDGMRTVLSMQNNYQGPPESFALVIPVPVVLQKDNVKTLPRALFNRVDQAAAPRLVEYWEQDPCPAPEPSRARGDVTAWAMAPSAAATSTAGGGLGVKIEAEFTVGEYDVLILSAEDALGLDTWLKRESYKIPDGAAPILRPYVQGGMKFFVAKVDPKKVTFENGQAMLSPLRFHYDSDTFSLPIRLGLVNSGGTQDLIVHVLGRNQRYEVANYPNVTIPTNLDVAEGAQADFGAFYAALFDKTLEKHPGAVVTEYAWAAGSCDPCPAPSLTPSELMTLGADVLPFTPTDYEKQYPSAADWRRTSDFVLTRLHARYTKASLGQDLVFRAVPPIMGGREVRNPYPDGPLETGVHMGGGSNNFQGRYAIRHPWTGPITCLSPKRGVWGGPPGGAYNQPKAAQNLAFAKRGLALAGFLRSDVPELGVKGMGPAVSSSPMGDGPWIRVGVLAIGLGAIALFLRWAGRKAGGTR